MSVLSDFLKDVEKSVGGFAEDLWKSDVVQIVGPAAIGFAVGGPAGAAAGVKGGALTGAVAGASLGLSSLQQEKAIEEAEKLQEKQIAAQKEMQEKHIELETLKMEETKQLADVFTKQDQPLYIAPPRDIVTPAPIQVPLAQMPLAKPSLFVVGIVCLVAFFIWKRYPWSD